MEIKILKYPLPKELNDKVENLLNSCFPHESQEEADFDADTHYSKPVAYVLAFDKEEPISAVLVFARYIAFAGQNIFLGGLGGVCTKEEFRKQGIATELLKAGLEELKKFNCDVAYLGTDENLMELYEGAGFKKLNRQYEVTGKSGKKYLRTGGMLMPINSQEKFDLIMNSPELFKLEEGEW